MSERPGLEAIVVFLLAERLREMPAAMAGAALIDLRSTFPAAAPLFDAAANHADARRDEAEATRQVALRKGAAQLAPTAELGDRLDALEELVVHAIAAPLAATTESVRPALDAIADNVDLWRGVEDIERRRRIRAHVAGLTGRISSRVSFLRTGGRGEAKS